MTDSPNDNVADLTIRILERIQDRLDGLTHELGELRGEVREFKAEVRTEFTAVRDEMRGMRVALSERIDQSNARIDNVIFIMRREVQTHEERLQRLEESDRQRRPPRGPKK